MESLAIWLLCTADNINVTVNWTLIGPFHMQNCHPVTGLKFPSYHTWTILLSAYNTNTFTTTAYFLALVILWMLYCPEVSLFNLILEQHKANKNSQEDLPCYEFGSERKLSRTYTAVDDWTASKFSLRYAGRENISTAAGNFTTCCSGCFCR